MPRRPAPTPLRLHPGPTPARDHPKFTLPSLPTQSFYPTNTPTVPVVKKEIKYFQPRSHKRSGSSSSISSVDSDESAMAGTSWDNVGGQRQLIASAATGGLRSLPPIMTKGPRPSNHALTGMAMPEFKPSRAANPSVRNIEIMGPWEHSRLRLSEAEICAMVAPPQRVVANPCPVIW